jgi:hypothetical protein
MGESVHVIEKIPEALFVATKEIVLEVYTDKTKYMVMSLDRNARRNQYVQTDDSSFERVDDF